MNYSFIHRTDALVLCFFLFAAMIVMVGLGRIVDKRLFKQEGETKGGLGSIQAALFGLFGFILAFAFGMSANRFDAVRNIVVRESNDIRTAIQRLDLYPDSLRSAFHADFRDYLDARISLYKDLSATDNMLRAKEDGSKAAEKLWSRVMALSKLPNMVVPTNNMIAVMNNMVDTAALREVMLEARVPDLIVYMLLVLALTCSFIGGFTTSTIQSKDWIIIAGFALLSSMVIYITLDLGRPLRGIIKAETGEKKIIELRDKFK